jgi:hypothetical protein
MLLCLFAKSTSLLSLCNPTIKIVSVVEKSRNPDPVEGYREPDSLVIDKNSLFGGLKIPKGELCVKEIFHTISGVWVGGLFSRGWGELGIEVGRGVFNHWGGIFWPF